MLVVRVTHTASGCQRIINPLHITSKHLCKAPRQQAN